MTENQAKNLWEDWAQSSDAAKRREYALRDLAHDADAARENPDKGGEYYAYLGEILLERMRKLSLSGENPYFDEYNRALYRELTDAGYRMNGNGEFDPRYFEVTGERFGAGPALTADPDLRASGLPSLRGGLAYEDAETGVRVSLENGEYTEDAWEAALAKALREEDIYGQHGMESMRGDGWAVRAREDAKAGGSVPNAKLWRNTPYENSTLYGTAELAGSAKMAGTAGTAKSSASGKGASSAVGETSGLSFGIDPSRAFLDALDAYVRRTQATGGNANTYAVQAGKNVLDEEEAGESAYGRYAREVDKKGRYRKIVRR